MIYCVSGHKSDDHFTDRAYWINDDGLVYAKAKDHVQVKPPNPKIKDNQSLPLPSEKT
jgi:hypothetical protein